MKSTTVVAACILLSNALARDVPLNVRAFYNRIQTAQCTGPDLLKSGFYSQDDGPPTFGYCKDNSTNAIYIHGFGSALANMDIDCDGAIPDPAPDKRCKDSDTKSETRWKDQVQQYSKRSNDPFEDLNPYNVPYVVFGNEGSKGNYSTFDPRKYGVHPLSVMAVVCGDQLIYGIWGDTNGDDDGSKAMVGEASISLATACYPNATIDADNGHAADDVLYIAFPGSRNETVNERAAWGAASVEAFERSISEMGDRLIGRLH
ncbi:hypothetical protein LTR56_007463 [Elasticomyces elasticus]|nr:hypothetical protein LTR56_007463 [Elasticomyces elasticus]KAK3668215.1 hypothetical protein LTR22_000900 [Elasticomyces elasticus]KAK4921340.1 hypothetical protein LTR49_011170 [Elasticomyces elasticus]KAK5769459.1 hypothetical protein LTS12_000386 [Elasticomyces elasticus]